MTTEYLIINCYLSEIQSYKNLNEFFIDRYGNKLLKKINKDKILTLKYNLIKCWYLNNYIIYSDQKFVKIIKPFLKNDVELYITNNVTFVKIKNNITKYIIFNVCKNALCNNINIKIQFKYINYYDDIRDYKNSLKYDLYLSFDINRYYQDLILNNSNKTEMTKYFIKSIDALIEFDYYKQKDKKEPTNIVQVTKKIKSSSDYDNNCDENEEFDE